MPFHKAGLGSAHEMCVLGVGHPLEQQSNCGEHGTNTLRFTIGGPRRMWFHSGVIERRVLKRDLGPKMSMDGRD
jgi:hypothetical protein